MWTCLKNYSYSYIYIFGNFPSRPCHMLYLPLGFWGFQVNLKTQEQKSVHTCRNVEGYPKGVFYTKTDGWHRNGGALLPPGEGTGGSKKEGQPPVLCLQLRSQRSVGQTGPGHRQHAQAWTSPQSQLNQHPQEVLECDPDPSGVFWKRPQLHSELRTTAIPDLLPPCGAHRTPTSQSTIWVQDLKEKSHLWKNESFLSRKMLSKSLGGKKNPQCSLTIIFKGLPHSSTSPLPPRPAVTEDRRSVVPWEVRVLGSSRPELNYRLQP